jgi:hypothetical protein
VALYKKLPMTGETSGAGFAKGLLTTLFPALQGIELFQQLGAKESAKELRKQQMISRAIAKEQGMLRSRNLKIEKQTTDELTKQQKLKKAGEMFDDERISIAAALKNESLDRNEILRLELKKALINENASKAEKLADQLAQSQRELASLQALKLANPFQAWEDSIARIRAGMGSIGAPVSPITPQGTVSGQQPLIDSPLAKQQLVMPYTSTENVIDGEIPAPKVESTVNVYVSGTGGLDAQAKKDVVDAVIEMSAIGYSTSGWYRTTGNVAI